jgi:hypothetical protein
MITKSFKVWISDLYDEIMCGILCDCPEIMIDAIYQMTGWSFLDYSLVERNKHNNYKVASHLECHLIPPESLRLSSDQESGVQSMSNL